MRNKLNYGNSYLKIRKGNGLVGGEISEQSTKCCIIYWFWSAKSDL